MRTAEHTDQVGPMEPAEYRIIVRSMAARIVFTLLLGAGGVALSLARVSHLGIVPTAVLAIGFGYGIGGKFFPDSGGTRSFRFRNYRRARRGLPPLPADREIVAMQFDDFRRG